MLNCVRARRRAFGFRPGQPTQEYLREFLANGSSLHAKAALPHGQPPCQWGAVDLASADKWGARTAHENGEPQMPDNFIVHLSIYMPR